ncbi:MAG TPA: SCO family protein [Roseiarcus sp.]|nr:SCO family protein [Roseiarcus sp.]
MSSPAPSSPPMLPGGRRVFIVIVSAALVLAASLAYVLTSVRAGAPAASLIGGPFKLVAGDGRTITDADMKGEPFLVFFGYTHCPDVCPATLAEISDVLAKMPGKPVKALFITIDPERDSAAVMKDYVSNFDPRIIGLTGDRAAIDQVEKAYRVYARKAPQAGGDYTMDHSAIVYLMDSQGRFVEAFNLERKPEDSAKELEKYL